MASKGESPLWTLYVLATRRWPLATMKKRDRSTVSTAVLPPAAPRPPQPLDIEEELRTEPERIRGVYVVKA